MEQHITKYNEFYSKNGQFVGGTDSMITSLFTGIENISGGIFNMIVRSAMKFLAIVDRTFQGLMTAGGKAEQDLFNIMYRGLKGAQYEKIPESQIPKYYGAFQLAMKNEAPAFYGGAECNCGENVMDYWTNSAYLVFKGGVETEKNVAFMIRGIETLIDLITKSMKSKSSDLNEPQVRELVKLYSEALEQLKKAVSDVNHELMKKNANLRKDFDTYAKFTPEEIIKQLEYKAKNNAARVEFLNSIKMLAPTAYYANTLKDALSKLGLAVKDFEAADTEGKFSSLMNKLMLNISASDPSYTKKMEALEILKQIHQSQPTKFEAAAEDRYGEMDNEEVYERPDYGQFFGGGGESIFGGELLELDKKVNLMSTADKLYKSPLEMAFKQENEKMLVELVQSAQAASDEMYEKKSVSDDKDLIDFLSQLDTLRLIDYNDTEIQNIFFNGDNLFGIGYSRDVYLSNIENVISAGKKVEGKLGPKFAAFIKYLESYKKFLHDSSNRVVEIVSKKGFHAKFFGGLYTQWSYTLADVVKTFNRGIMVSMLRIGLDHSVKELEAYDKNQTDMNAKIMGREINAMVRVVDNIMQTVDNHKNFPIPKELTKVIIQENLDGFIQLQRGAQALNNNCKSYQLHLVKNPAKAREIAELLRNVAIDINSIGDETFKHLTDFLEYFHIESVAKNGNIIKDVNEFNTSHTVAAAATKILDLEVAANRAVDACQHKLNMYDNDYLGKDFNQPTPYPIRLHDVLASHVPTMICATKDANHIKKSGISDGALNAYGGKRVLPCKISDTFLNPVPGPPPTYTSITIDANTGAVAAGGNDIAAAFNHVGEYAISGTITGPAHLPKKVKFLNKDEIIMKYNEATEHLNKGVRQLTSLKNLFSVFQSIDKAYKNEKGMSDNGGMKIGEIYECFVNYIVKTTRYPVLYKVKIGSDEKYVCSHIALRKFGHDAVIPCDVKDDTFRTTRNDMFGVLDKLSLREYSDGADYNSDETTGAAKWRAEDGSFPKTSDLLGFVNKNTQKLDKSYFSNDVNLSKMFSECDNLCVMSLKSVICKIFSILSLFNVINLDDLGRNLPFNQLRAIYGGIDLSHTITPNVNVEYCELYIRLYLLMVFYKGLFFEEAYGAGQQHIVAGAKRMAVLPSGNGTFDELLRFIFLRKFDTRLYATGAATNTMDSLSFGIFIDICNKLAEKYKGGKLEQIQQLTLDLVDEINKRYGIVSTDQIKTLMEKENKRIYPGISRLNIPGTQDVNTVVDRLPPTLLDGEGGSFRNTKVDSDNIQFGETTVGRILTLINPDVDKFNMTDIMAVVYNFRKKLDSMTENMNTELNARNNAAGNALYKQNNISNKIRVLRRQLSEFNDNRGKLEYLMGFIAKIGDVVVHNVNNDEIIYKELVLTPCAILNKLYNRLIAICNLYGKQTYNNILNLNTHLYDLNSINTDLVRVIKTADMPKLDFSVLAKTCDEYMQQIITYHKQYVPNLANTGNILDKTINLLINQHTYVWHPEGPLSDTMMDYKSVVYVPLNDYSEFPNILYNAGSEDLIGTNSWTAYKGRDVYDDPVQVSDPRNKVVRSTRPGRGGDFPVLNMQLLSQRFSPKNVYQLFEYSLICMYKVFFEPTGVIYQPLFADFVGKLPSVIDFQNIIINDAETELGGAHGFQKGLPFSDKIAAVYRMIYNGSSKAVTVQPDITLLPSESIQAMRNYLGLFIFLFKYIITQAYIHSQILAINRYSGGEGLSPDDRSQYTQGTAGTHELFPVIGAVGGPATYVEYYQRLIKSDRAGGLGMRIYSGYEPSLNLKDYPKLQDLKTLATETIKIDKAATADLKSVKNLAAGFSNLSFGADLDTVSRVFLDKYTPAARQLFTAAELVYNKNDTSDLEKAAKSDDPAKIRSEIKNYYEKGIKQDFFSANIIPTAKGASLDTTLESVFDNQFFNKTATFCRKYIEDVCKDIGAFYLTGAGAPITNSSDILLAFLNGDQFNSRRRERFNIISKLGITASNTPEVIFPARNLFSNSYLGATNAATLNAVIDKLSADVAACPDPLVQAKRARPGVAVTSAVAINNGIADNIIVFEDYGCTTPAIEEKGITGKRIYTKISTARTPGLMGFRINHVNDILSSINNGYVCNVDPLGLTLGQNGVELSNDTLINIVRYIDNIATTYTELGTNTTQPLSHIGLINDALLMYNKFINLPSTDKNLTFENYLPHFIKERIDLIFGKDYEAFIDMFGYTNPTIYATENRRSAGDHGGAVRLENRPANPFHVDQSCLGGLTGVGAIGEPAKRASFSKIGITIDKIHYSYHGANIGAPGVNTVYHTYIDINEKPGSFIISVNGVQKQSNIYEQFEYTDCNPYYDVLLATNPLAIFEMSAAAGTVVNGYCRKTTATPSELSIINTYPQLINSQNGVLSADRSAPLNTARTTANDLSHDRSMQGLTRKLSTGYDGEITDHVAQNKSCYMAYIYNYMFRHIVACDDDPKFEVRYNKFKTSIANLFMYSYTKYETLLDYEVGKENNTKYSYVPLAPIDDPFTIDQYCVVTQSNAAGTVNGLPVTIATATDYTSIAGAAEVGSARVNRGGGVVAAGPNTIRAINNSYHNIGIHRIMSPRNIIDYNFIPGNYDISGTNKKYRMNKQIYDAAVGAIVSPATFLDEEIAANFTSSPDSLLLKDGLCMRSSIVNVENDTAVKNRCLRIISELAGDNLTLIVNALAHVDLDKGPGANLYNFHQHLCHALSMDTPIFLNGFRALLKILIFGHFLASLQLSTYLDLQDFEIYDIGGGGGVPNITGTCIPAETIAAFDYYLVLIAAGTEDVRLGRAGGTSLTDMLVRICPGMIYTKDATAVAGNYTEVQLSTNNNYFKLLSDNIDGILFPTGAHVALGAPGAGVGKNILSLRWDQDLSANASCVFNPATVDSVLQIINTVYSAVGVDSLFGDLNYGTTNKAIPANPLYSGISINRIANHGVANPVIPPAIAAGAYTVHKYMLSYSNAEFGGGGITCNATSIHVNNCAAANHRDYLRIFLKFALMAGFSNKLRQFGIDIFIITNAAHGPTANGLLRLVNGSYKAHQAVHEEIVNFIAAPATARYMRSYPDQDCINYVNDKIKLMTDIQEMKYKGDFDDPHTFRMSSGIEKYFIQGVQKNKCLYNLAEVLTYLDTISKQGFINRFVCLNSLTTIFRRQSILPILKYGPAYYINSVVDGGGGQGTYVKYEITQPNAIGQVGAALTAANFVTAMNNFNLQYSGIIRTLTNQYPKYKSLLKKLYFENEIKKQSSSFSSKNSNIVEPGNHIKLTHIINTQENVPALAAADATTVARGAVGAIVNIEKRKIPSFIDENYIDRNCLMAELVVNNTNGDDYKARSKNAITFGMSIYKSLVSTYAELNETAKYLHVDSSLDEINTLISRNERKTPITYAVELIPNIINTIGKDAMGVSLEANILKTPDVTKIKAMRPLGIHCRNIYDLDKLFNGDKSDLLRMIKPFILADTVQPLTIKDFSWTEKMAESSGAAKNTLSSYIQTTAKLTKYLYEIQFKSMFGNMFPVFNNLDNPKFDIVTAPGPGNTLGAVVGHSLRCYNEDLQASSLQTSLPGVLSYRNLTVVVNNIFSYDDMIELTFARTAAGASTKSIGFIEPNMISTQELISLLEIDSNSDRLNNILAIPSTRSILGRVGTNSNYEQLLAENILDIGVFPLNIHSMAKEIPMAELINNVYSYDIIMKWLLGYEKHSVKGKHYRGVPGAGFADSRITAEIAAAYDDDTAAGLVANRDKVANKLFNYSTYNYCVNPLNSYVFPVGINDGSIVASNWIMLNPSLNGTSKLNKCTKSKLDNMIGIHPTFAAAGHAPTLLELPKADDAAYTFSSVIGRNDPNTPVILTEEYIDIENPVAAPHPNKGVHLINGIISNAPARGSLLPVQYNFGFIDKPDPACHGARNNLTMQTIDLNLGVQLSDIEGKVGDTVIKKSKLVRSLVSGKTIDKFPTSNAGAIENRDGITGVVAVPPGRGRVGAVAALAVAGNVLDKNANVVEYPADSYYDKQHVGNMKSTLMDLMNGVDPECQQPVLGLNIFADVLMNIYTAKLYDEIKTQRQRSSQVSIGEAAIFDQYYH